MDSNQEQPQSLDDMGEDELIQAFKDGVSKREAEPEEVTQTLGETTEVEQPEEATTTEPEAESSEEVAKEESSSDILDFSKPVMLKDRDLELPVNNSKEMLELANKGLNYTRKTQVIAEHKNTADYMSKHGITMDKLQALVEIENGSKEALNQLAQKANIDLLEVDPESKYQPKQEFAPLETTEVDMVANEIQQDPTTAEAFRGMMDYVPDSFKTTLSKDANTLRLFGEDVKSGVAKQLMPEAVKIHALRGGDFVQSYIEAGNIVFGKEQEQQTPEPKVAPRAEPSPNRAKAGVASSTSSSSGAGFDVWEASDSELMDKINQMTNR